MKPALQQQATRGTNGTLDLTNATISGDQTLALFFSTDATANNTITANAKLVIGATDLTHNLAYSTGTLDAGSAATALSNSTGSSTACLMRTTSGGSQTLSAALNAILPTGIRINQSVSDAGLYLFNELSLAGSDHVAPISTTQFATTDAGKVITHGAGGVPDSIIGLISVGSTGTDVGAIPQKAILFFWDGTNTVSVTMTCSTQTNPTLLASRISADAGHIIDNSGADIATFSLSGIGTTSFTLSRTATGGIAAFAQFISFRHTSGVWASKCGIATTPTLPGLQVLATGMLVPPQVLMTVGTRLTSTALKSNTDEAGALSFGVACNNAGTTQQYACAMTEKNGVGTTVAKCYTSNALALATLDNTGALLAGAGLNSWNSDGAALNHTTASIAIEFIYFLFGIATAGTPLASISTASTSVSAALSTAIKMAAAASANASALATFTEWKTVTLQAPLYLGVGGIRDPIGSNWVDAKPVVGDTIFYDGTHILIDVNGRISSDIPNTSAQAQFNNGSGWALDTILITGGFASFASALDTALGALTSAIQLATAATDLVTVTAQLTAGKDILGRANVVDAATGALTAQILLTAAAIDQVTASSAITSGQATLAGTAADSVNAAALLTNLITLAGAAHEVVTAAGALATGITLAATAGDTVTAIGALTTHVQIGGTAAGDATALSDLSTRVRMAAAAQAIVAANASLATGVQLGSAAADIITASALLRSQVLMIALAGASANASANLLTFSPLVGFGVASVAAHANLSTVTQLSGIAWAGGFARGRLTAQIQLGSAGVDAASAGGDLIATGSPVGIYISDSSPYFEVIGQREFFTTIFSPVAAGQHVVLTFNFSDQLNPGETLVGRISIGVNITAGIDDTPTDVLTGPAAYDTTLTEVLQPIIGALDNVDYYLTVLSMTSQNRMLYRYGLLQVRN